MAHLEGVLTLVTHSGPWFRLQGLHVHDAGSGVRVTVDPYTGLTLDLHLGSMVWLRLGWFPSHFRCQSAVRNYPVGPVVHRCWARILKQRTFDLASILRPTAS